jgi:hypothetical protein
MPCARAPDVHHIGRPATTVVCRHEQNAAFIAGGIGRVTGKAGVAIATSGPGVSNLITGLATANSEGDPIVRYRSALELDASRPETLYNIGLIYKYRRAWPESLLVAENSCALRSKRCWLSV